MLISVWLPWCSWSSLPSAISENAHTEEQIFNTLPSQGQPLVARATYGRYLMILTEAGDGTQIFSGYRQVPFKRYAKILDHFGLELNEKEFVVTGGQQVGDNIDYFVVARSNQSVAFMQAAGEQYPVVSDGEYHFSVGRFPLITEVRFLDFRFIDSAGNDLGFSSFTQN